MAEPEDDKRRRIAGKSGLSSDSNSVYGSDISTVIEQIELLKRNEKRLQELIDKLPARISFINDQEKFVSVNDEWASAYGLKREKIIGSSLLEIIGHVNYKRLKKYFIQVLNGQKVHFEAPFVTRDGKNRWLEIYYIPEIDAAGKVLGFYGLSIDRTEKKQIEKEKKSLESRLHQAQKMEAIGTLAGGIAHDFNNILSGIFGYSQLAQTHIHDPEQATDYIRKIFNSAQRASLLVQQILTFSRHSDYDRKPLNVYVLVKEALKLLRSTIPTNIEIKEEMTTRDKIMADSTQIHQVIMNLCTNAYHAMAEKGGQLTITLEAVELSEADLEHYPELPRGTYLRLVVADTGPGIEPRILSRIFDPYFTTKDVGKGTGLGLAVVDGIVKKHNGFIHVDSTLGKGTSFFVFLPVIKTHEYNAGGKTGEQAFPRGHESIMVVDDEADIRETTIHFFENLGYTVLAFSNGQEALAEFKNAPDKFDLVITDMTMPYMTGDTLSRELLKINADLPIILCTGYHESFTKEVALDQGIQSYIQKPVPAGKLCLIVRDLLDKSSTKK